MKEILSPYIGRGTCKNFKGDVAKHELGGGIGEGKDMKHVKMSYP